MIWLLAPMLGAVALDQDAGLDSIASALAGPEVVGLGESSHEGTEYFAIQLGVATLLVRDHGYTVVALENPVGPALAYSQDLDESEEVRLFGLWMTRQFQQFSAGLRGLRGNGHDVHVIGIDPQFPAETCAVLAARGCVVAEPLGATLATEPVEARFTMSPALPEVGVELEGDATVQVACVSAGGTREVTRRHASAGTRAAFELGLPVDGGSAECVVTLGFTYGHVGVRLNPLPPDLERTVPTGVDVGLVGLESLHRPWPAGVGDDVERVVAECSESPVDGYMSRAVAQGLDLMLEPDFEARRELRDRYMAENVLMLRDDVFPGQRIVVLGHTTHVARFETWMGAHLADSLDDEYAVLGQTDLSLEWTRGRGNVEEVLRATGVDSGWVDLRGPPALPYRGRGLIASPPVLATGRPAVDVLVWFSDTTPADPWTP